jgi:hypothetical protein
MNKIERLGNPAAYDADFARWCAEQGALLRAGRLDALDRENLAEEIEGLGRSDRYEIESRLEVLLLYLLKWAFRPEKRKNGWRLIIVEQRSRISDKIVESPSLRSYPKKILQSAYRLAHAQAEDETGLPFESFPDVCPFTVEEILDPDFYPEAE